MFRDRKSSTKSVVMDEYCSQNTCLEWSRIQGSVEEALIRLVMWTYNILAASRDPPHAVTRERPVGYMWQTNTGHPGL